jgi:hypothetical protein
MTRHRWRWAWGLVAVMICTRVVRGVVLGSDGNAVSAGVNTLPVMTEGVKTGNDGGFELSWSPEWQGKAQSLYVVARAQSGGETALVRVSDPNQPVTVRLAWGFDLQGIVVDSAGRRLDQYEATLSLPAESGCRPPVLYRPEDRNTEPTPLIFWPVPYGHRYDLTITAYGYQPKHVTADATDTTKAFIDLGKIALDRADSTRPAADEEGPWPSQQEAFDRVQQLEEGEILKFIETPHPLQRYELMVMLAASCRDGQALGAQSQSSFCYEWDGDARLKLPGLSRPTLLHTMLSTVFDIPTRDVQLSEEFHDLPLPRGDWIVRKGASVEDGLQALAAILNAKMHRSIRFEKQPAEVWVVTEEKAE